jgi:signal transduction histidine kinase
MVVFFSFYRIMFGTQIHEVVDKNISNYSRYIISNIGIPPDTTKAKIIAEEYSVQIRFESLAFDWATSKDVPSIKKVYELRKHGPDPGWLKHRHFIVTNPDGSKFLFIADFGKSFNLHDYVFSSMLLLLLLIFVTHYFVVRHTLKPIKWLTKGVNQVREGNLNHQIPIGKKDELGRLTEAFNDMIKRVREMIKARDQLLLDVSHELRSPMTRIKVALEFLQEGHKKNDVLSDLAEIEAKISEIIETERLKDGFGKLNIKEASIGEIIELVANEFNGRFPEIKITPYSEKIILKIDVERIKTIIRNVLENAIKFSKLESKPIEVSFTKAKNTVNVNISDDGTGVPNEDIPYLFEPFYRVDRSRSKQSGGYGLGLSLCKKIMEAHGGEIEFLNNTEGGSTVLLKFVII